MSLIDRIEADAIRESLDRKDDPWVNADVVVSLREALGMALRGEISSVAIAAIHPDGASTRWINVATGEIGDIHLNLARTLKMIEED